MLTARPAPANDITVSFEHDLDPASWTDLASRVAPPLQFLAHGWWRAWGDAVLPDGNWRAPLRLAVARDGSGAVQAVLPAAEQSMLGLSVLSLAGNYKPFRSPLIAENAPPETAAALVDFFRQSGARAFRMGPVVASQPAIASLRDAFAAAGWQHCLINRATNYLIDLPADVETFRASLAPRKFKRIRANMNRLEKQGTVRIERCAGLDAAGWEAMIGAAASIEKASWLADAENGDFNFADPATADFWRAYLAHPEASRNTGLWLLHVDDRPVSFTFAIDSGDHRYCICGLYDQAFNKASPGSIIDSQAVLNSFEHGISAFDLGQGDSGYKANWGAAIEEQVEDWIAFPPTAAGKLLYLAARAKFGAPLSSKAACE